MRTLAVLPVKSYDRAKTRTGLDTDGRVRLAQRLVTRTLGVLAGVDGLHGVVVVTREARAAEPARRHGFLVVDDPDEASHSRAALLGVAAAVQAGAERVLLVPGDCPQLRATELDELLQTTAPGITVVGDRHGTGTNALLLHPPDAIEPAFGPGSFARHAALARGAGVPVRAATVPSLAFDVDTAEDLADAPADHDAVSSR